MTFHRLYVKWRCFIGKGIDIWSKNPYPSNILSNLHDNSFGFDGVKCCSMEGFLQSLKYKDTYFPVAPKRGSWETFVRVNKDALPNGTLLTFTSDIHVVPMSLQGMRIVGEALYKSPSFGWLREECCGFSD